MNPTLSYMNQFLCTLDEQVNFLDLFPIFTKLQLNFFNYCMFMSQTYIKAIMNLSKKQKFLGFNSNEEIKQYQNLVIDVYEDAFTSLFQNKDFSIIVSDLMNNYLDFKNFFENISNDYLKKFNLLNRDEMDLLLKDLRDLKRDVNKLKKNSNL